MALLLGSSRHALGLWRALSGVSAKTSGAVRCRSGAGRGGSESTVEQWMMCRVASVRGVRSAGAPSGWRVLDRIGLTRADFFSPFRHPGSNVRTRHRIPMCDNQVNAELVCVVLPRLRSPPDPSTPSSGMKKADLALLLLSRNFSLNICVSEESVLYSEFRREGDQERERPGTMLQVDK